MFQVRHQALFLHALSTESRLAGKASVHRIREQLPASFQNLYDKLDIPVVIKRPDRIFVYIWPPYFRHRRGFFHNKNLESRNCKDDSNDLLY